MATLDKGGTVTLIDKCLDELARLYHEIKDEKIRKEIEALIRRLTMARSTEEG